MNLLEDWVVPQLAKPTGFWATPVVSMLNRGNRVITAHTIGALDIEVDESVLEIGFGGGIGFDTLLDFEPSVRLRGLDLSHDVVARATKRYPQLELRQGDASSTTYDDRAFDAVFAVNVAYFWSDIEAVLSEILRILRVGGRLALGVRPAKTCAKLQFAASGHREWEPAQYAEALAAAGFDRVAARRLPDPGGGASVVLGYRT